MDRDSVQRMADEGTDRFVIPPLAFDPAGLRDALARFADEVMTKVGVSVPPAATPLYDTIGDRVRVDPSARSRTSPHGSTPRSATRGGCVNVGAGAGSYEPTDRQVVAVEPSTVMLAQRPPGAAPAVQAVAEALPFADATLRRGDGAAHDAPLDRPARRDRGGAAGRGAASSMFTFDTDVVPWIVADYLPEIIGQDKFVFPPIAEVAAWLDADIEVVPVPHDCTDGFTAARTGPVPRRTSTRPPATACRRCARSTRRSWSRGMDRLRADLESGAWDAKWGHLRDLPELDLGYRLLVAPLGAPASGASGAASGTRCACSRGGRGRCVTWIGSSASGSGSSTSRISAAISTFL